MTPQVTAPPTEKNAAKPQVSGGANRRTPWHKRARQSLLHETATQVRAAIGVVIAGLISAYLLSSVGSKPAAAVPHASPSVTTYTEEVADSATPDTGGRPLPAVIPGEVPPSYLVQQVATVGELNLTVAVQDPQGEDALQIVAIKATNVARTPTAFAGVYFDIPPQGMGANPKLAIDLNSPDPNVRVFRSVTSAPLGIQFAADYFAAGNYLAVDSGGTQSFTLYAVATQGTVTFNLAVTYIIDGRQKTMLVGDGQGHAAVYKVTALSRTYQAAYYLGTGPGDTYELIKTSWAQCRCPPGT